MPKQKPASTRRTLFATLVLIALALPIMSSSPWLLSAGLILGCGVYVAFEFALVKTPVRQLERDAEDGTAGAAIALKMKHELNAMLAACQFGITVTSLGLTLALEPAIEHALARYAWAHAFSAGLALAAGAFLHVTFGELVPKGLALVVPQKVLYATAPFMRMFRFMAIPFIKTCNTIANAAVKTITGKNPDEVAEDDDGMEIGEALLSAHARGELKPEQFRVMRNVLAFADRTAREVMTHAKEVVALDLRDSWEQNMALVEQYRYSRYPVIDGNWHKLVGYVRKVDLLRSEMKGKRELKALVLPIEQRPETVLLRQVNLFQGAPVIALYDEYDNFVGLLTAEDVVEQIVGEIYDETDDREAPPVERVADGTYRVAGAALIEEVAQTLNLNALDEHQDIDTIGGLMLKQLGRRPRPNDQVTIGPYQVTVESAQGFRINKLRFERTVTGNADDDDDGVTPPGHTGV